jgi:long-subunit acyl-CoA synthetase (AMP-forming)
MILRGEPMMLGYWRKPEATAETIRDGWLHTGDLVVRDA